MPDRSPRLLTFPPRPLPGAERGAVLLRERPSSPPETPNGDRGGDGSGGDRQDDNPFAPPPEGSPDQPWRPRHPEGEDGTAGWGSQWSDRQPGRSTGGFGQRPGSTPEGPGGKQSPGPSTRWDPTDPVQRRARFALLSGMWSVFFVLFGWSYVALLLGALALYWGISSLRAKPSPKSDTTAPRTGTPAAAQDTRPQSTAAIGGIVTASLALLMVATTFAAQLAYRDYFTCVNDALTQQSKQSCETLLPKELRGVLGVNNS
ncbi:hypothetical protein KUM39_15645 [Streptomyces sp. J2-1]|uniref:hypothetical protein n=1 Tax=Streptomyces corallincola TaxID=2851888 RepID=UPI001C385623|nr:hypothetical protein [Streptomyces corallincola]MBV2355790.1 hypothetical protein [Streptomyces corallincola]